MIKIPYYETSNFVFSNFSPHTLLYRGILYPTLEHAYHAAKFDDVKIKEEIQHAPSPLEAWKLGKKYKPQRRSDWDKVKLDVMHDLMTEKVRQHEEVKDALLATGHEEIVEENSTDAYWGAGPDGEGQNHTGKLLMEIRADLQAQ